MNSKSITKKKGGRHKMKTFSVRPSDVAKYFLWRSFQDGDLITPLRMQKLIYFAYGWTLAKTKKKLFDEEIQAWPMGPVVPSLYRELKKYRSAPIGEEYLGDATIDEINKKFPGDVQETLDEVYKNYMTKTAFELVVLAHASKPWKKAREGLAPTDSSNRPISDEDILEYFSHVQA